MSDPPDDKLDVSDVSEPIADVPTLSPTLTLPQGDFRPRRDWVRQYIFHKTIADDAEIVVPGAGPAGAVEHVVANWRQELLSDHEYRGAHLLTGYDGTIVELCDPRSIETFHATASNAWSVGHEMCERPGGEVFEATLEASVKTCVVLCRTLGIQLQIPRLGSYTGHPIHRMDDKGPTPGGPDMVGVFGHRDNTERRGRWDPGDKIFEMLAAAGAEQLNFAAGEDLEIWRERQQYLVRRGHPLTIDGVPGPATVAALKTEGYVDGIWALGK